MDVNGSRFHILVTESDWTSRASVSADPQDGAADLEWDAQGEGLRLRARLFEFRPKSPFPTSPPEESGNVQVEQPGRGGVFDAYGNLYFLTGDRLGLRIRSVGDGRITDFWPVTGGTPARPGAGAVEGKSPGMARPLAGSEQPGAFHAADAQPADYTRYRLDAIVVTACHYLVAASAQAQGLLIFDLYGAGPPLFQPWSGLAAATALLALEGGGIGVLLGSNLVRLGSDLKPCVEDTQRPSDFTVPPPEGSLATEMKVSLPPPVDAAGDPCILDLSLALPPGVEVTAAARAATDRLLVLGRLGDDPTQVWLGAMGLDGVVLPVRKKGATAASPHPPATRLNDLIGEVSLNGAMPGLAIYPLAVTVAMADGMALTKASDDAFSAFVVAASGDQAFRFDGAWVGASLEIDIAREYWPMRRYSGFGLAVLPFGMVLHDYPDARVFYAIADRFAPLLSLPQPRYVRQAQLETPALDGRDPRCVWHRLMLDMRLPPGVVITVETRVAEDRADLPRLPWRPEPALLRSVHGSELPWRDAGEIPDGSFETLLQSAQARWLQARITVVGDGQRSPLLRRLRVWYPRFSYAREYLPPVFREDPVGADFLDRLLALFEGEFTRWEDRIATVQWLFDARTAPAESLEWLAGWLGLAFDPTVDECLRRLMIRHAMTLHARRGTVPGMLMTATLAWERDVDETWLQSPEKLIDRPHGVRLQELFGLTPPLAAGVWTPSQGRAALVHRLGDDAGLVDPAELSTPQAPTGSPAGGTSRAGLLARQLGFLPRAAVEEARLWSAWSDGVSLPADEAADADGRSDWSDYLEASQPCAPLRKRWQEFLARRWRRISALNAAWATHWRGFERISSPAILPSIDAALADWHRFESRVLRGLGGAHRFRVVLPLPSGPLDINELGRRRQNVALMIERDKPAHTVAEVRFGFDLFRVGEARLGLDTRIEEGLARRPELAALGYAGNSTMPALLGQTEIGGAVPVPSRPQPPADRIGLDRG